MKRLIIILLLGASSCLTELPTVPELFINLDDLDERIVNLDSTAKDCMNGVYKVEDGESVLGPEVVGKWVGNRWCIYAKHDVVFSINAGGALAEEDSIIFTGYIRMVRSGSGMKVDFYISPNDGGKKLVRGEQIDSIIINGTTSEGKNIVLTRTRPLNASGFHILAHRGGGRNSERLGISENSINMILHAETFGATGVEIDVKRTKDGKLILFHDETFSPRTVMGAYLLGRVENFSLKQIQMFGRLINGEPIPTLKEALEAVYERTNLSLVWIDIKDKNIVENVIQVVGDAADPENNFYREGVKILLGIPSDEVRDAFISTSANDFETLVELNIDKATDPKLNCKAWAPRWTNCGSDEITLAKTKIDSVMVFTWTVDVREYISQFLDRDIDGILSNYPSLLAGMYYSR